MQTAPNESSSTDNPAAELERRLVEGFDVVVTTLRTVHERMCGSPYIIAQSERVRPVNLETRRKEGRETDPVILASTGLMLTHEEVALARWTLDDMFATLRDTPQAAELRAKFEATLGVARFRDEQARAQALLAPFSLVDPATGKNLFDPLERGALFIKHWAHMPFVALTQSALEATRALFQRTHAASRQVMHHLVDNVAALTLFFPVSDINDSGELAVVLELLVAQALWVLRADAIRHRRLDDVDKAFARYVFEYHLGVTYATTPKLTAAANLATADTKEVYEDVPHWRLYMRLVPLHVMNMGPLRMLRESIIVGLAEDRTHRQWLADRARHQMLLNEYRTLGVVPPPAFTDALATYKLTLPDTTPTLV